MHDVAWRGKWICVHSKDAQKQLARTSLICNSCIVYERRTNKLLHGHGPSNLDQLASLFAPLMFAGLPNHSALSTMV